MDTEKYSYGSKGLLKEIRKRFLKNVPSEIFSEKDLIDIILEEIHFKQWTIKITSMGYYNGGGTQFQIFGFLNEELSLHIEKDETGNENPLIFFDGLCRSILKALDKRTELNGR